MSTDGSDAGWSSTAELNAWVPSPAQRVLMALARPIQFVFGQLGLWRILPSTASFVAAKARMILKTRGDEEAHAFCLQHAARLRMHDGKWPIRLGIKPTGPWPLIEYGYWRLLVPLAHATSRSRDATKCRAVIEEAASAPWPWLGHVPAVAAEQLSRACHACGSLDDALRLADRSVTADPTWPGGWKFGAWLRLARPTEDAESFLRRAMQVHPQLRGAILQEEAFRGFHIVERIRGETTE